MASQNDTIAPVQEIITSTKNISLHISSILLLLCPASVRVSSFAFFIKKIEISNILYISITKKL